VLLAEWLRRRQLLDEVGGVPFLMKVLTTVPSSAHVYHYAGIVREKAILRGIIAAAKEALRSAYSPMGDDVTPESLAMKMSGAFARIGRAGKSAESFRLGDACLSVIDGLESGVVDRVPTGLATLDDLIGGLRFGGKTIIGAYPRVGKSQLIKQIGLNVAAGGVPFGLITVEESRRKVAENTLANYSGVYNNRIAHNRFIDQAAMSKLIDAAGRLGALPFFGFDTARKLSEIAAAAHVLAAEHGCRVIAVDHLHIIDGEADARASREQEMSRISGELKWLWKDLNVAGIEAAQLNRKSGKERPSLQSLRDSGSLEQDGDTIILLHREDVNHEGEDGYRETNTLEAFVEKNKDGASGVVPLHFDGAEQRIADKAIQLPEGF
jgi:replicative DNA helicase